MSVLWGLLMATIGGLLFFWGRSRSESVVYRLLAARSRILWGDRVHSFYQVVGVSWWSSDFSGPSESSGDSCLSGRSRMGALH